MSDTEMLHARLNQQADTGIIKVKCTYARGGLWGSGLRLFEFDSISPSRSGFCHFILIAMPGEEVPEFKVVVGHHEGDYTITLEEMREQEHITRENYGSGHPWFEGWRAALEVVKQLTSGEHADNEENTEFNVNTGITFDLKES